MSSRDQRFLLAYFFRYAGTYFESEAFLELYRITYNLELHTPAPMHAHTDKFAVSNTYMI